VVARFYRGTSRCSDVYPKPRRVIVMTEEKKILRKSKLQKMKAFRRDHLELNKRQANSLFKLLWDQGKTTA